MPSETIFYGRIVERSGNTILLRGDAGHLYVLTLPPKLQHLTVSEQKVAVHVSIVDVWKRPVPTGEVLELLPWRDTPITEAIADLARASGERAWKVEDVVAEIDRIRDDEEGSTSNGERKEL